MELSVLMKSLELPHTMLKNLSTSLETLPYVVSSSYDISVAHYNSGDFMEAYVEIELNNERAVTWWADIYFAENQWNLEARILITNEDGQSTLKHYPLQNTFAPHEIKKILENGIV